MSQNIHRTLLIKTFNFISCLSSGISLTTFSIGNPIPILFHNINFNFISWLSNGTGISLTILSTGNTIPLLYVICDNNW